MPLSSIPPAPVFDWGIEAREATRLAAEGGPEATSIVWTNRGTTDQFGTAFGASAAQARAVVDAALASWQRVITSWNRADGTTTLQVEITMDTSPTGATFGAAGGPNSTAPADGKPRTGAIGLGRGNDSADPNDSNGWYLDPTPYDNSEFMGDIHGAFTGVSPSALGPDLYSVVIHEMAHVLGNISDPNNAGGPWQGYLLENMTTNTGITDYSSSGGGYGKYYAFQGSTIDHLLTSFNSGDLTAQSWGNPVHTTTSAANCDWGGQHWRGAHDVGNAYYSSNVRIPPDFVMSHILADAYSYTIADPAAFGTFYAVLNQSNGVLTVRGGAGTSSDVIVIGASGGNLSVSVDVGNDIAGTGALPGDGNLPAWTSIFNAASVGSIEIYGGDGTDYIRLESNFGKQTSIYAQGGDDYIDFGYYGGNLGAITGDTNVWGGDGTDGIYTYDWATATPQTFTIDYLEVNRGGGFGGYWYGSDIETVSVTTGDAADTVNVYSTDSHTAVTLGSDGGGDTVNIGQSSNGVRSVAAPVYITNAPNFSVLNINDAADTVARTVTVSNNDTWGFVTGLAPADILWKQADVQSIGLTLGSGSDSLNLERTTEGLAINGTAGEDVANLGVGGTMQFLGGGGITFKNPLAFWTINANNEAAAAGQTISLGRGNLDGIVFGILSGMAPATITYIYADTRDVNLVCGSWPDTVNVLATGGIGTTNVAGTNGQDTIAVGDAGSLANVTGALRLTNRFFFNAVIIDAAAEAVPRNVVLDKISIGGADYGRLTGLAPAAIEFKYSDTNSLTITTGTAVDVIAVRAVGSNGKTTLSSSGGNDVVTIGGGVLGVSAIAGDLYVQNPPAFSQVTIDDTADTTANSVYLTTATVDSRTWDRVDGLAPGDIYLRAGDIGSSAVIAAGSGVDTFFVRQTASQFTWSLRGGGGNDQAVLGDTGGHLSAVAGGVTFEGEGGAANTITLNDSGETASGGYVVQSNGVVRTGGVWYTFSNLSDVHLYGGTAASTVTYEVNSTAPTTTTWLHGGSATDAYAIKGTSNPGGVRILASGGADQVYVNPDGGTAAVAMLVDTQTLSTLSISTGGQAIFAADGTDVLRVNSLGVAGELDLTNNTMIYDYTSPANPTAAVGQMLRNGFNGGAWNGASSSITSSTAAGLSRNDDCLGYAAATDLFSAGEFPATFAGQLIDNTTVLVRYTLYGDASLNRAVDLNDFTTLAASFGLAGRRFAQGDFSYDSVVDLNDFTLLAGNFGKTLSSTASRAAVSNLGGIGDRPLFSERRVIVDLLEGTTSDRAI